MGNHDTFDPNLSKSGIQQGQLFYEAAVGGRGEAYAEAVQTIFDSLPLFVIHRHFLATHAGPVRGGITRLELINCRHYPDFVWQMTWNRINDTHSNPNMKEYGPQDLDDQRRILKCPPDTPVIVGHNPLYKWGGDDSIWINVLGAHDYVIICNNLPTKCPYLSFDGSSDYEVKYADLKLKKRRFVLDDY